ncbi:O-antigen ligase family protein [Microbacterium sp. zg-Y818]|uniref:O-antigen ligase family protein n=1 Tax=unclassified Microbacterium TaxID=2609290 RepID=UPI00214AF8AA|nr:MULTISPECIES: O-antigen ligase family protein [unclassified Microbacterium]MCR2801918.1 O-antigen ligase family protein [Microbacterium sp. zg.Y818]WIM22825.1 O-antigen ligase family protein [Microbacterium sp. zg-Y818]
MVWIGGLAAAALVAALFTGPTPVLIALVGVAALAVLIRWPAISVGAVILLGLTAWPAFVPYDINVGPITIRLFEPFLIFAAAWALFALRPPPKIKAFAGVLVGVAAVWGVAGYAMGYPSSGIIADIRGTITVALMGLVVGGVYGSRFGEPMLKTIKVSLWISAAFTLAGWTFGLPLAGRAGSAGLWLVGSGAPDDSAATRYLTSASELAVIAVCVTVAMVMMGVARLRDVTPFLMPAALIVAAGFSRNSFLAIGVAAIVALLVARSAAALRGAISLATVAMAASVVGALIVTAGLPGADLIASTWAGFEGRVLGGIAGDALALDSSARARFVENMYATAGIAQSPILGNGFGYAYRPGFGPTGSFTATSGMYYAHNYWLWVPLKTGIIGAVLILGVAFIAPTVRGLLFGGRIGRAFAATSVGVLVSLIYAPFPNDSGSGGSLAIGLLLGAVWATSRRDSRNGTEPGTGERTQKRTRRKAGLTITAVPGG